MRMSLLRLLCVALFVLVPGMLMQGCSSTPAEDEDLEGEQYEDEDGEGEDGENYSEDENGEYSDDDEEYAEGNEEGYDNEGEDGEYDDDTELADNEQLEDEIDGQATDEDLEGIIAGQNADASGEEIADAGEIAPDEAIDDGGEIMDAGDAATTPIGETAAGAGPALPQMGSKMPYIVRVGETLSGISQKIYGSSEQWRQMAELTSIKNPNLVKPGDVVYYQLSQETMAFASAYEGAPKVEVTVQSGDTLAGIAQRVYGQQGDWKVIWRQNAQLDNPDRLEVGQTLYYLSPEALTAALNYARNVTVAQLIDSAFGPEAEKAEKKVEISEVSVDVEQEQEVEKTFEADAEIAQQVTGFELAKSMFGVFATNLGLAG